MGEARRVPPRTLDPRPQDGSVVDPPGRSRLAPNSWTIGRPLYLPPEATNMVASMVARSAIARARDRKVDIRRRRRVLRMACHFGPEDPTLESRQTPGCRNHRETAAVRSAACMPEGIAAMAAMHRRRRFRGRPTAALASIFELRYLQKRWTPLVRLSRRVFDLEFRKTPAGPPTRS